LGKVLYEMATGRDRLDYPELPTDLEERPDRERLLRLNAVIAKACAPDSRRRYQSARGLFEDLARVQRGKGVRATALRRRLEFVGCIGATIAVLVGLGALVAHFHGKAPTPSNLDVNNTRQNVPSKPGPSIATAPRRLLIAGPRSSTSLLRGTGPRQTGERWTNSLGMVFAQVPGTKLLFSVWETRVQDYSVFMKAVNRNWPAASFEQGPTEPAVKVSWFAARWFCDWLTREEQNHDWIEPDQRYRLPTDEEWSAAVGLDHEEGLWPSDKNERIKGVYPWGSSWPPPASAGNYGRNGLKRTSVVGNFASNPYGLYDLGGNVWEWCEDTFEAKGDTRVMRGASWYPDQPNFLLSSHRSQMAPRFTSNESVGFRAVLAGGGRR
jgi:hypothetical protein